jgi:XRE family transcriptional regulator, regulator of sulfur utilization
LENLNIIIANNLKQIREGKKMSLDKVSELTGVSKSMLGQIERGESNPTITTVWKIANGLKVSFTALISTIPSDIVIIKKNEIQPLIEDNSKYRLYPFFPYEDGRRFEVYSIEIEKGGYLNAEGHSDGTQEFITVFEGEVIISVNGEDYKLEKGEAMRFRADKTHIYHNSGNELAVLNMVIYYPL